MEGQLLSDAAQVGKLLKVAVHPLIAHDRQEFTWSRGHRMVCILFDDGVWDRKQGNLWDSVGLRAVGEDPSITINSNYNVGFREFSDIAVGKSGVAAK